jgi:hypothetical protein
MKKVCKYFSSVGTGGEMILGDCVRDRCEFWDKDNTCCIEVTQAKALEKLSTSVYTKITSVGESIPRLRLEQVE